MYTIYKNPMVEITLVKCSSIIAQSDIASTQNESYNTGDTSTWYNQQN